MSKLRVLVVEDSLTVRKRLIEVLDNDPDLTVVGEAADGQRAIELCQELRPDVITMDMMLPVMTGLAATEYIMAYCPTPILIVSASTNRGELFRTYEALAAGALYVIEKSPAGLSPAVWERQLIDTVKLVARVKVITHPRARLNKSRQPGTSDAAAIPPAPSHPAPPPIPIRSGAGTIRLVAIGASTGGPAAVLHILRALPPTYPVPILIVLHLAAPFAASLAEWLDQHSPLRVSYARHGEKLPGRGAGRVIMAPADCHLEVDQGTLRLTHDPERFSCRPSVDVLFESVARSLGPNAAGVLLTGMGRDGAGGLLAMHRAHAWTAAQDEASSIVFGMPREAILLGAAQHVLPLEQIAPALQALVAG
ncbi:MAG TPA: chemotaxis-specific protein-glutamate methyltransferase CheB [Planctomycetota bacterium]|nr:chemotaxis-specific protein-glutamate methyltransferase CheB [Planctomycetota bacterium]